MKGPIQLIESEDNWITKMGAWFPGKRVVLRGKDLLHEMVDQRWMGIYLYGITGRVFSERQVRLFEGLWSLSTSFPDPRLWNNQVASLAGTVRCTRALGMSAAIAISEATIYGHRPIIKAFDFFKQSRTKIIRGTKLVDIVNEELKKNRKIPGYGRPIIKNDERIKPVYKFAEELGFVGGEYVKLAFEVEDILIAGHRRMQMNIAALAAALAADQGLSCEEYYSYVIPCFVAGIMPCIIDSLEKSEGTFFPLPCNRIGFKGKTPRKWR